MPRASGSGVRRSFLGAGRSFLGAGRSFLGAGRSFLGAGRSFLGAGRSFLLGRWPPMLTACSRRRVISARTPSDLLTMVEVVGRSLALCKLLGGAELYAVHNALTYHLTDPVDVHVGQSLVS
jgi:hypothetical protein